MITKLCPPPQIAHVHTVGHPVHAPLTLAQPGLLCPLPEAPSVPAHPVSSPWRSLVPGLHTPSPILPRLTLSHTGYRHTRVHSCMAEASGSLKSPHWAGSIPGTQAPSSAQASARWLRRLHGRWATVSQHAPLCGFCGLQVVMTTECWTCPPLMGTRVAVPAGTAPSVSLDGNPEEQGMGPGGCAYGSDMLLHLASPSQQCCVGCVSSMPVPTGSTGSFSLFLPD